MDIGAHHPFQLSNTAYLWLQGWNGINVDASEEAIRLFNRVRHRDLNIHAAVVSTEMARQSSEIRFYSRRDIDNSATCDEALAKERGYTDYITVPCRSLASIIAEGAARNQGAVDYLNIDIEGLDEAVLEDLHICPVKPTVIMVEIYGHCVSEVLNSLATQNLAKQGYVFTERTGHTAVFINKNTV